ELELESREQVQVQNQRKEPELVPELVLEQARVRKALMLACRRLRKANMALALARKAQAQLHMVLEQELVLVQAQEHRTLELEHRTLELEHRTLELELEPMCGGQVQRRRAQVPMCMARD
ncbi:hypothetical protein GGF44_005368, partial [Coemansia sp. RSA 1694]